MAEHAHRDRVLDLVYGELQGIEARALRDELERCPECGPELAKLEGAKRLADALPLEPLPSTTRAALIAAARLKANESRAALPVEPRGAPSQTAEPNAVASGTRDGWWDRARRFLLGPQTAMAAVMLVVVAIGVMYLPGGRQSPVGTTAMRPEPDVAPDVAPDLTAADREDEPGALDVELAETDDTPAVPRTEGSHEAVPRQQALRNRVPARATGASSSTASTVPAEVAELDPPSEAQRLEAAPDDAIASNTDGLEQERSDAFRGYLGRGARAAEPSVPSPQEPAPPAPSVSDDLDVASRALAPAAEELAQRALHQSARSRARAGDCRGALRAYSDLFARFPAYSELPRALVEAASCQRELGNLSDARALLVRAEGYPSARADAQRELRRLDTVQQAQRRARRSAPSPRSADEAAAAY